MRTGALIWNGLSKGAIHSTKIQTGPTGKSGPPQKVDLFFRNFSGWTEPIHWVLDRNFRKFWLNGSRPKSLKSLRNLNLNQKSNKFSWSFFTQNVQTDSQNVRTWRTRDWTKVDSSIYLNGTVTNAKVSATLVTVQISTNLYIIFSFHHLLTYWFCKPSYYYILYQLE